MDSLSKNGYPKQLVNKVLKRENRTRDVTTGPKAKFSKMISIPYIPELSNFIKRSLRKCGVETMFKPSDSLKRRLVHLKDPMDPLMHSGCVYRIPCGECLKTYVGETKRRVAERIKEHKAAIVHGHSTKSALSQHLVDSGGHVSDWNKVKIMDIEPRFWNRRIKEAIRINQELDPMNRDEGVVLPAQYRPLIAPKDDGATNNFCNRGNNLSLFQTFMSAPLTFFLPSHP